MNRNKTALIGFHDRANSNLAKLALEHNGYAVTSVTCSQDMLEQSRTGNHHLYLMNLTLGQPNSGDVSPAQQVYTAIFTRVIHGKAAFHAFSSDEEVVKTGIGRLIPSYDMRELVEVIKRYI